MECSCGIGLCSNRGSADCRVQKGFKAEVDHKTVVYQPWHPTQDVTELKILGKALEELGELVSALARCVIQGIDEAEPVSKKPNKQWLAEEVADVIATTTHVIDHFGLERVPERAVTKHKRLAEWHAMK